MTDMGNSLMTGLKYSIAENALFQTNCMQGAHGTGVFRLGLLGGRVAARGGGRQTPSQPYTLPRYFFTQQTHVLTSAGSSLWLTGLALPNRRTSGGSSSELGYGLPGWPPGARVVDVIIMGCLSHGAGLHPVLPNTT